MKLNLIPTSVKGAKKSQFAWVGALAIAALGVAGMVGLTLMSSQALSEAKQREADLRPQVERAVTISNQADEVISQAQGIIRNSALSAALVKHNTVYPDLYDQVLPYIPRFFRLTSISASPSDAATATITMQGVLDSYQDYANLMIALMRIQGASAVGRTGFVDRADYVPPLTETDNQGRIRPNGSAVPIPDNDLDRLAYFESQGAPAPATGVGGFGDPNSTLRFAGPESSLISVTLVMSAALQVPDTETTLRSGGGTAPSAPAAPGIPASAAGGRAGRVPAGEED